MPHPQPLPHPSSADVFGGLGTIEPSKDTLCTPVPIHPQVPLPSTSSRLSVVASTMTAAFQDPAPSQEQRLATPVNMGDSNALQWAAQNNDLLVNHLGQDGYHLPFQFPPHSTTLHSYNPNSIPYNENYNLTYSAPLGSACPRSYTNALDLTGLPMTVPESYPPAAYQLEPQRPHEPVELSDPSINGQLMQLRDDYDNPVPNIKHEEHTGYSSPYDSDVTRSSTPSGEPPMPPHNYKNECAGEEVAIEQGQPYAQLIYRALMEAPGHTMILRDIYDWFKKNTDKAADKETKGWQNSIRHNLSMNGAFEKVDHPSEDSKKGFMWRLTNEAIREGVKSTTRYRSKQPTKRGHRTQHPLPQRQASGAKGGQAARRSARMRRTHRINQAFRSEPYGMPRSVTSAFDPFHTDITIAFPSSPYYSADGSEMDFDSPKEDFGGATRGPNFDLFPPRSYNGTPFSQDTTVCGDTAYIQLPIDPAEPIFTNSPSPTADEPRTPDSQPGAWDEGMVLSGAGATFVFDTAYNEFPV